MYEWRLLFYALLLEIASLYLLIGGSRLHGLFVDYLLVHGISSGLIARGVWGLMPAHYQEPRLWSRLLIFALAFFVPAAGLLAMLVGMLVGYVLPAVFRGEDFGTVEMPSFTPVPAPTFGGFRQEDLKSLLTSSNSPTQLRLLGMTTVSSMSTRITGDVLRQALGDPVDDVRLLAYGILDQKEKQLTRQISRALSLLDNATPSRRYRLYRRIGELYWEMSYQNLVQGDIRSLTLEQATHYVDQALMEKPDDAGMWLLRGRILQSLGQLDEAEQCFLFCRQLGTDPSRVNPWLAELALWQGRYARVRVLMKEIDADSQFTSLSKAVNYWRQA